MKKTIIAKLLVSILLFAQYGIGQTGASFSDSETKNNNIFTSGWWKTPEVNIVVPQGGEVYALGDTVPIEWEVTLADPTSDYKADVFISKDSGSNYDQVANDLNNATTYDWEIPLDPSYKTTHMMVKVIIEDDHSLIGQDESNEFDPVDEITPEVKTEEPQEKIEEDTLGKNEKEEEIVEDIYEEIIEEEKPLEEELILVEETTEPVVINPIEPIEVEEALEEEPQKEEEVVVEDTKEETSVEEDTQDKEESDSKENEEEDEKKEEQEKESDTKEDTGETDE
jgi:hypothetical protein